MSPSRPRRELSNPHDSLTGDGRPLGLVHVDELAPNVGQAGNHASLAGAIKVFEPGIAIVVHPAGVTPQMVLWVLAFAVA